MKTKIFLIFFAFCLFTFHSFGQTELAFQFLDGSGAPITGLTGSEIKFKATPYTGSYMTGLTVTEHGTQGNYKVTGFTTFQLVKCYINDIEQTWLGQIQSGDAGSTFLPLTGGTMTGVINMGTQRIEALADPNSSDDAFPLSYGDARYAQNSAAEVITGTWSFDQATFVSPYISSTITVPSNDMLIWKAYADANYLSTSTGTFDSMFVIRDNRLIVDSKLAADIAGLQYNDISSAITYAQTQTPSGSSIWSIYILPAHGGLYQENITLPDYINLTGIGQVAIRGVFSRTGSVALSSRVENIYFEVYDGSHVVTRTKVINCVFQTFVDANDGGIITVTSSLLRNTGLFGNYTGGGDAVVSGQNNAVYSCFGNFNVSWYSNDKILGYDYNNSSGFVYNY